MEKKYGVSTEKLKELFAFQRKYGIKRIKLFIRSVTFFLNEEEMMKMRNFSLQIEPEIEQGDYLYMIRTEHQMKIPVEEIIACNFIEQDLVIEIKFRLDYTYDKCLMKMENRKQMRQILNILQSLPRKQPEADDVAANRSKTDFDDSRAGSAARPHV